MHRLTASIACFFAAFFSVESTRAANPSLAPDYEECWLQSLFPAGGGLGQTVEVNFYGPTATRKGDALTGLRDAVDIVIDGKPGITVESVENKTDSHVIAKLRIASDAPTGRRMLRVASRRSGLTNFAYFDVSGLPEVLEGKKNNDLATAEKVAVPTIVNGRIEQPLDVDCFRFEARAGQTIVAAIQSHGLDCRGYGKNTRGYVDASLELLDARGGVVAQAEDTLGLDPIVSVTAPEDGWYTARVYLSGYQGFPEAVYRLTLGEVALPMAVFPAGGRLGSSVDLTFDGINLGKHVSRKVTFNDATASPLVWMSPEGMSGRELPFVLGSLPEAIESEPNSERSQATIVELPTTINARFDQLDDVDWYRIRLNEKQNVRVSIVAQQYLRSPVDTVLEAYDSKGEKIQSNDDAAVTDVEQMHDFNTFDSAMVLKPKGAGDYFVRVAEQTGSFGPRAVYRLTGEEATPDFKLHQWPDAVPIWGPGSTAGFLVTVDRMNGWDSDIEFHIEGLPEGWTGSTNRSIGGNPVNRILMTITSPPDAKPGTSVPFRAVGRSTHKGRDVEHQAQPLTSYTPGDRQICRVSPASRVAIAEAQGPYLKIATTEIDVEQGSKAEIPVQIVGGEGDEPVTLIANQSTLSFRMALGVQTKLTPNNGEVVMPLKTDTLPPGRHGIVVAWAWASETRKGMPGPCTPIFFVNVRAKDAAP